MTPSSVAPAQPLDSIVFRMEGVGRHHVKKKQQEQLKKSEIRRTGLWSLENMKHKHLLSRILQMGDIPTSCNPVGGYGRVWNKRGLEDFTRVSMVCCRGTHPRSICIQISRLQKIYHPHWAWLCTWMIEKYFLFLIYCLPQHWPSFPGPWGRFPLLPIAHIFNDSSVKIKHAPNRTVLQSHAE